MLVACLARILLIVSAGCLACGPPPTVSHATVSTSTMNTSSGDSLLIATYQCDSSNGYATRGNNTIACLSMHGYSLWTSVQVSCVRVRCNSAPYMNQATSDYTVILRRSRQVQRYRYGYYYVSHYYYDERRRGQHAVYSIDYYNFEESKTVYYTGHVTFTCNANYFLPNGSQAIRTYCGDNGRWIEPNATCQGKDCGELSVMEGVACTGASTRFPNRKSCRCISGYERVNNRSSFIINCLASGTWSNPTDGRPVYCTRVNCGIPPTVNNSDPGATVTRGTRYEDRVTYTCLPGYEVRSGSYSIQCQANRRWTAIPACIRKDCNQPPTISNGHIPRHLFNTTFDSEVKYSCDSHEYEMVGSAVIRCSEDGTWSTPPLCHKVNCGSPPHVPNSERHVFGHSVNDTVTYECDVGYSMVGNESITCQVFGHWTIPPTCEELSCGDPPEVENAENSTIITGTTVGSEARYTCITGYVMIGKSVIECLPNQQWSTLPQCNRIRCGNPPQVPNGARRVYGHYLNDFTKYRCHTGYNLVGDVFIRCKPDGHWSVPPECYIISCGIPPTTSFAAVASSTGVHFGNTAYYQCLPGYHTGDLLFATCQLDGTWSRPPTCTTGSAGKAIKPTTDSITELVSPPKNSVTTTSPIQLTAEKTSKIASTATNQPTATDTWKTSSIISRSSSIKQNLATSEPRIEDNVTKQDNTSYPQTNGTSLPLIEDNTTVTNERKVLVSGTDSTAATVNSSTTSPTSTNFKMSLKQTTKTSASAMLNNSMTSPKPTLFKTHVSQATAEETTPKASIVISSGNNTSPETVTGSAGNITSSKTESSKLQKGSIKSNNAAEHKTSSIKSDVLIGCTVTMVAAVVVIAGTVWFIFRRRRTGEHNFIPVSNALYESDGESMTVYSFKEGCDDASGN